ncbi:MAG: hypothetical protein QW775_07580 [Ignisphaera sp.]
MAEVSVKVNGYCTSFEYKESWHQYNFYKSSIVAELGIKFKGL